MKRLSVLRNLGLLVLALSVVPLHPATGALANLTLTVNPNSAQTVYGSTPPTAAVEVNFLSSEATDEHLKLSANMVSVPAGQNAQATITSSASSNASLEMFESTSHIKAVNPGVVNAKFIVSMRSGTNTPLAPGTYTIYIFAGSTAGSLNQLVTFVISPPPTPSLSTALSKIWFAQGATSASESNNTSSVSAPANSDIKTQVANLTVDLRDTNNSQINYLPITVTVTGPGLVGIGSNSALNNALGKAIVGQPGQYAISVFADGTYGNSTVSIFQNGQLIGSRSVVFTAPVSIPTSISISNVAVTNLSVSAGNQVKIQFSSTTTGLASGQEAFVSINSYEDCEVEGCAVAGAAALTSGDSTNGTWQSNLQIPSNAISGEYTVTIYFPKLKGINGFYYRYPSRITVKGIDPAPPAPSPTVSLGQISLNKNDFKIGETLIVRVPVKTTNFYPEALLTATIYSQDECEDTGCSSYGTGKIVSGNLQDGIWEISMPIHQSMITGTYSLSYGFFKLKGISGAIGPQQSNIIKISGLSPPPPAPPITISISNIVPKEEILNVGQMLNVGFEVVSTNLDSSQPAQVYLFPVNGDDTCEEGCGSGLAKLVSGTLAKGYWNASFIIPTNAPSGSYILRVIFPKLKGISGFYSDSKYRINLIGSATPTIVPYYNFSNVRISTFEAKAGQSIEGYFSLQTNDDKVSTPACIIDGVTDWTNAVRIKGSPMVGEWVCNVLLPLNSITGTYKLQVAVVGYANNNKNEEWATLGNLSIYGVNSPQTLTIGECQNLSLKVSQILAQSVKDLAEVNRYILFPESFRNYFLGNTFDWNNAYSYLNSIWNKNLTNSENNLSNARSTNAINCETYPAIKGVFVKFGNEIESTIRQIKDQNSLINQWFSTIKMKIPDPQKYFNPQVEIGSIEIQEISEKNVGLAIINFGYQSNSGVAKLSCSVNVGICTIVENGRSSSGQTIYGIAELRNYSPGSNIVFSLQQFGNSGKQVASIQQPYQSVRAGLQPKIGPVSSIASGCTFKILNYDPAFNWYAKSELKILKDGTATIKTQTPTDEYISTSRNGYQTINALNTLFKCIPKVQTQNENQDSIIEDDGVIEEPSGDLKIKKESSGKYLFSVISNLDTEKISLVATRKGKSTLRFSATTNEFGSVQIRTSRNMAGYTIKLIFDGITLGTTKVS